MSLNKNISDNVIIDNLNTHYNINVVRLALLPLGADQNASVYKAESHDQSFYFVKIKKGHGHDIGVYVLGLLHDAGIQQVISPVKTCRGHLTQYIDDFTMIVYPFIEGQDGFSRALTNEQWQLFGKTLRQIHNLEIPSSVQHRIRHENYSPQWRDLLRSLYPIIEAEPSGDDIARQLHAFMNANFQAIQRLVDRADQLAKMLQHESLQFVLCHSDIHGGNILMPNDSYLYIVDWDEPIMAPKERDLMFIGGGVANVWNKPDEEAIFYKGYGATEINKTILSYYRHERIVEDIAVYGQALLLTMAGGESRLEMYGHTTAMFEENGVVDIAFKTDEIS